MQAIAPTRRALLGLALVVLAIVAGLAWMLLDAEWRRKAHRAKWRQIEATVRILGAADLVLSSTSRWLRHPSLTEPGAPFAESPAILDADPGGGWMGPPREPLFPGAGSPTENPEIFTVK